MLRQTGIEGKKVRVAGVLPQNNGQIQLETTAAQTLPLHTGMAAILPGFVECHGTYQQSGLMVTDVFELRPDLNPDLWNEACLMTQVPELAALFEPDSP